MTLLIFKTERYLQNMIKDTVRARRRKKISRLVLLLVIAFVASGLILALTFSGAGMITSVEARIPQQLDPNFKSITQIIDEDAGRIAGQRFSDFKTAEAYREQLLAAYSESADKDFLILFNPGGWGGKTIRNSPDWVSIIEGMRTYLEDRGKSVAVLNYLRTENNLRGQLHEFKEMVSGYTKKAGDLVELIYFVTRHHNGLKVIITGESTGTIICDSAMKLMSGHANIYSIQTGPPFWHKNTVTENVKIISYNGQEVDTFSEGNLTEIVKSSLVSLFKTEKASSEGQILGFLAAPGHEYWWENQEVNKQITDFLNQEVGIQYSERVQEMN